MSDESPRDSQSITGSHWKLQLLHNPLYISIGVNKHVERTKQLSRSESFQRPRGAIEVTVKMHSGVSGRYTFQGEPHRYTFDDRLSKEPASYSIPLCVFIAVKVGGIRARSSAKNKSVRQRVWHRYRGSFSLLYGHYDCVSGRRTAMSPDCVM